MSQHRPIRVLLAEDHELVRSGLRALLQNITHVKIVGEVADGLAAIDAVATVHPDLVLMDITMPELNGLDATRRIVETHPDVRVLIVSVHRDDDYVRQALEAGAVGYLLKDADAGQLAHAVQAVARGDVYLHPAVSRHVADAYAHPEQMAPPPQRLLTLRQREVLQLVGEGNTTKEIAAKLGISVKTVEHHRTQLKQRLGIPTLAGLVRYAVREGLVSEGN